MANPKTVNKPSNLSAPAKKVAALPSKKVGSKDIIGLTKADVGKAPAPPGGKPVSLPPAKKVTPPQKEKATPPKKEVAKKASAPKKEKDNSPRIQKNFRITESVKTKLTSLAKKSDTNESAMLCALIEYAHREKLTWESLQALASIRPALPGGSPPPPRSSRSARPDLRGCAPGTETARRLAWHASCYT